MLVDSHCHIHLMSGSPLEIIQQAANLNIKCILNVATQWSQNAVISDIANLSTSIDSYDIKKNSALTNNLSIDVFNDYIKDIKVLSSVGIHPSVAIQDAHITADDLIKYSSQNGHIYAIGECGLDFYHADNPDESSQVIMFEKHIAAAKVTKLPLIIHTRNAEELTLKILRNTLKTGAYNFVIHCFDGSLKFAQSILDLGGYISFSGLITYTKNTQLYEVINSKVLPLDYMLIETDSPYLTPSPISKKVPNSPCYLPYILQGLANILQISKTDLGLQLFKNFQKLFNYDL